MAHPGNGTQLAILVSPGIHDVPERGKLHAGQREIVARGETDDAADATFALGLQEGWTVWLLSQCTGERLWHRVGTQRGKVVLEDEGPGIVGIPHAPNTR